MNTNIIEVNNTYDLFGDKKGHVWLFNIKNELKNSKDSLLFKNSLFLYKNSLITEINRYIQKTTETDRYALPKEVCHYFFERLFQDEIEGSNSDIINHIYEENITIVKEDILSFIKSLTDQTINNEETKQEEEYENLVYDFEQKIQKLKEDNKKYFYSKLIAIVRALEEDVQSVEYYSLLNIYSRYINKHNDPYVYFAELLTYLNTLFLDESFHFVYDEENNSISSEVKLGSSFGQAIILKNKSIEYFKEMKKTLIEASSFEKLMEYNKQADSVSKLLIINNTFCDENKENFDDFVLVLYSFFYNSVINKNESFTRTEVKHILKKEIYHFYDREFSNLPYIYLFEHIGYEFYEFKEKIEAVLDSLDMISLDLLTFYYYELNNIEDFKTKCNNLELHKHKQKHKKLSMKKFDFFTKKYNFILSSDLLAEVVHNTEQINELSFKELKILVKTINNYIENLIEYQFFNFIEIIQIIKTYFTIFGITDWEYSSINEDLKELDNAKKILINAFISEKFNITIKLPEKKSIISQIIDPYIKETVFEYFTYDNLTKSKNNFLDYLKFITNKNTDIDNFYPVLLSEYDKLTKEQLINCLKYILKIEIEKAIKNPKQKNNKILKLLMNDLFYNSLSFSEQAFVEQLGNAFYYQSEDYYIDLFSLLKDNEFLEKDIIMDEDTYFEQLNQNYLIEKNLLSDKK